MYSLIKGSIISYNICYETRTFLCRSKLLNPQPILSQTVCNLICLPIHVLKPAGSQQSRFGPHYLPYFIPDHNSYPTFVRLHICFSIDINLLQSHSQEASIFVGALGHLHSIFLTPLHTS